MLHIKCPWCGPRAQTEFAYGGDATVTRPPDPAATGDAEWTDYVYLRDNPKGLHDELWQHALGCRAWFKARRHTVTHEIVATAPLDRPFAEGEG